MNHARSIDSSKTLNDVCFTPESSHGSVSQSYTSSNLLYDFQDNFDKEEDDDDNTSVLDSDCDSNMSLQQFSHAHAGMSNADFVTQLLERSVKILSKVLPSFCQRLRAHRMSSSSLDIEHGRSEKSQAHPCDKMSKGNVRHLDGLRGIACLLVFNFHYLYPWTNTILHGYGMNQRNSYIHQLPIICLLVRGRAMVALFFAISGYVLSYKALGLARERDISKNGEFLRSISSSTFRRGIRLYGPPFFSMLAVAIATRYGAFAQGAAVQRGDWGNVHWLSGSKEEHPIRLATWAAQRRDFVNMLGMWANPWTWDLYYSHYGPHTWTIPLEFRSSMILFMVLLATFRLRRIWRMIVTLALVLYCLSWARWEVSIFLGGMLLVELDLTRQEAQEAEDGEEDEPAKMVLLAAITFVVGLYLLSYPDLDAHKTPGFTSLASWTPKVYEVDYLYWHCFGSLLVLWSINNTEGMQLLLESSLCQYLGKISFAFYLVHGPLLHSVGLVLVPSIWTWTGRLSNVGFTSGLLIGWVVMLGISIWIADLFWRFIDVPCTHFARKLETILIAD